MTSFSDLFRLLLASSNAGGDAAVDFDPDNTVPVPASGFVRRVARTPHYNGVINRECRLAARSACACPYSGGRARRRNHMAVERALYTFNPPLIGSPWYYLGIVLVVLGSYYWIVLTLVILRS